MEKTSTTPTNKKGDKESKASYGKFNNAEELLKAYNSLEVEFTQRSQKLKELESQHQHASEWEAKVNKLMEKYPIATDLSEELSQEIAKSGTIKDEYCLEKALLTVLSQKYKSPKEQAKEQAVIDEVLKDESLKQQIIDDYRKSLDINLPKTLPKGGHIPIKLPTKATSITEAGKMALEILKE